MRIRRNLPHGSFLAALATTHNEVQSEHAKTESSIWANHNLTCIRRWKAEFGYIFACFRSLLQLLFSANKPVHTQVRFGTGTQENMPERKIHTLCNQQPEETDHSKLQCFTLSNFNREISVPDLTKLILHTHWRKHFTSIGTTKLVVPFHKLSPPGTDKQ